MGQDLENGDEFVDLKGIQDSYRRQNLKDDIGVCVTIILITIFGIVFTAIKIVLMDMHSVKYGHLFGNNITTTSPMPREY